MVDQNELGNLGAIQATDIIGEELKRAAVQLSLKRSARSISRRMQTLGCWAIERRAANNGAASSPDISSSEAEPKASAATQSKKTPKKSPLKFARVSSSSKTKARASS